MIAKLYLRVLKENMELKRENYLEQNGRDELLEEHAKFQNIDSVGVLKLFLCGRQLY